MKANSSTVKALEGILKLCKVLIVNIPLDCLVFYSAKLGVTKPGVREDNAVQQYRGDMKEADLQTLWSRATWVTTASLGPARMIHTKDHFSLKPNSVRGLVAQFFIDESRMKTFVEFNMLIKLCLEGIRGYDECFML